MSLKKHLVVALATVMVLAGVQLVFSQGVEQALSGSRMPPSPHWRSDACGECHDTSPPVGFAPDEWEAVCARCHDLDAINLQAHPFGLEAGSLAGRMAANDVPLVDGHLSCASCHDFVPHCNLNRDVQSSNPAALRGPGGGDVVSLCFLCHDDEPFIRRNPHVQASAREGIMVDKCLMCHEGVPSSADDPMLRASGQIICSACHVMENHPGGFDHSLEVGPQTVRSMLHWEVGNELEGMTPSQIDRYVQLRGIEPHTLPLADGNEIACYTCHSPHDPQVFATEVPEGVAHSLRVSATTICQVCHSM